MLGIWFQKTEGAKFWMQVLTELGQRGVADVLIFCVDGLTGFPEAIEASFPHSTVQTCLVHQVRSSLKFVSYKDRKQVAADLRRIYTAVNQDHAADELQAFAEKWDGRYPTISKSWLERWEQITPFLAYPADVRRAVYTTDENVKGRSVGFGRFSSDGSVAAAARRAADRRRTRRFRTRAPLEGDSCWFWACGSSVASRRRLRPGCQLALRLRVGVVDPGAKRRFWD